MNFAYGDDVDGADFVEEPAAQVGRVASWHGQVVAPSRVAQAEFFVDYGQRQVARLVANGVDEHQHLQYREHDQEIKGSAMSRQFFIHDLYCLVSVIACRFYGEPKCQIFKLKNKGKKRILKKFLIRFF
jgi:hypothetical protein